MPDRSGLSRGQSACSQHRATGFLPTDHNHQHGYRPRHRQGTSVAVIQIGATHFEQMIQAAEAAYPRECCGLLAGTDAPNGTMTVTRVVPSDNVHPKGGNDRFEVDPRVRFDLMRELGEIGAKPQGSERIIGHYHSHPDRPATPSAHDLACAFELAFVWVIIGLDRGTVRTVAAHKLYEDETDFDQIPLRDADGSTYAIAPDPKRGPPNFELR